MRRLEGAFDAQIPINFFWQILRKCARNEYGLSRFNDQGAFSHNYVSHCLLKLRSFMTGLSFAEVVKIRLMQHAIRLQNECVI